MPTYTQLDIFGNQNTKRIYFRDNLGRFASREVSEVEKLFRENNRLKVEVETWKRKAQALAHYKAEQDRKQQTSNI